MRDEMAKLKKRYVTLQVDLLKILTDVLDVADDVITIDEAKFLSMATATEIRAEVQRLIKDEIRKFVMEVCKQPAYQKALQKRVQGLVLRKLKLPEKKVRISWEGSVDDLYRHEGLSISGYLQFLDK